MGSPYTAVVHQDGTASTIDFATFAVAVVFARARVGDRRVSRVEVRHDSEIVYAVDSGGETFAEGVIAETT